MDRDGGFGVWVMAHLRVEHFARLSCCIRGRSAQVALIRQVASGEWVSGKILRFLGSCVFLREH